MKMKNKEIVIFAEYEELTEELNELRSEMSYLLTERDSLQFVECKNIETAYMLALGNLEYKAYNIECNVLRIKRKIELIRIRMNRQESVDLDMINIILDEEFAEYQKILDEQINKMNNALHRSKLEALTDDEAKELKKLYRSIIKVLHPDLHPYITQAQLELFHNAVTAYENGDLESLRIISSMLSNPITIEKDSNVLEKLKKEKKRLIDLIESLENQIEAIKNQCPYKLKPIIESELKTEEKRLELEQIIEDLQSEYDYYESQVTEMLNDK